MTGDQEITQSTDRVLQGQTLSREQLVGLAAAGDECPHELIHAGWRVRSAYFGRQVRLCGIVAGKIGGCSEDCRWCAQSGRHSAGQTPAVQRTSPEDIVAAAGRAADTRAASIGIVNSGRRPGAQDFEAVLTAGEEITRAKANRIALCASLGELTADQARQLASRGFVRYNHNLETSRRLYDRMVTTHTYDDRLRTLSVAREAGLELCCGGIFGLGESWDDRVDLALTLRDQVRPHVVPLNFLHPIPGTPLADTQPLGPMEILRIVALYRLAMPRVDLKVAGGREANLRDLQSWMFYAGGTSCIIGHYLTTEGRGATDDLQMIADLRLEVVDRFDTP